MFLISYSKINFLHRHKGKTSNYAMCGIKQDKIFASLDEERLFSYEIKSTPSYKATRPKKPF